MHACKPRMVHLLVLSALFTAWIFLATSSGIASAFVPAAIPHSPRSSTSSAVVRPMSDSSENALPPLKAEETAFVFIEYQNEFTSPGGKLYDAVKDCMEQTKTLENSVAAVQAARDAGCTIIHCPISFEAGHNEIAKDPYGILAGVKSGGCFTAGEWGADFFPGMRPVPGDLVVKGKSGLCGFESTNLQFLLSQNGIKNVVLGGFLTNCCVESTMRSACKYGTFAATKNFKRRDCIFVCWSITQNIPPFTSSSHNHADEKGFKVFTLKDCVAATSLAAQEATLEYNFGMFSVPTTSNALLAALQTPAAV